MVQGASTQGTKFNSFVYLEQSCFETFNCLTYELYALSGVIYRSRRGYPFSPLDDKNDTKDKRPCNKMQDSVNYTSRGRMTSEKMLISLDICDNFLIAVKQGSCYLSTC